MAAIAVLGLKVVALLDLDTLRGIGLIMAAGWGRWGQVVAIARYPYLKPEGKGAFHKAHAHPATDWLLGIAALLCSGIIIIFCQPERWWLVLGTMVGGCAIALLTGAWFNRQLGGHTGDTYGAIVEWTEVLLLCLMVGLEGLASR
jgi:adenosylcobinamide-GDP ribazoletransferase